MRAEHRQAVDLLREARRALQAEQEERMSGREASGTGAVGVDGGRCVVWKDDMGRRRERGR